MSKGIEIEEQLNEETNSSSSSAKIKKILLLGHDYDNNLTLKYILKSKDYEVEDFMYKDIAKLNLSNSNEYCLFIFDLGISPKSIFETYEKIKKENKNINALFVCEFNIQDYDEYRKNYLNNNSAKTNIIRKPFDNKDFLDKVNNIIKNNQTDQNKDMKYSHPSADSFKNIKIDKDTDSTKDNRISDYKTSLFENIGGLDKEIKKIRETISVTFNHSETLKEIGVETSKGILLHGLPGTGKTLLVKEISKEIKYKFYYIDGPEMASQKNYGEAEQKLRTIFEEANQNSPSIIFIDEIDSIGMNRDTMDNTFPIYRLTSQLLTLMDGMNSKEKVVVIGSTNRLNIIDPALRRTGRFDKEIEIKAPDKKGRLEILKIYTKKITLAKDINLKKIADESHGYVGADLNLLVKEAVIHALKRYSKKKRKDVIKDNDNVDINIDLNTILNNEKPLFKEKISVITIKMDDFMFAFDTIKPSLIRKTHTEISDIRWESIGGLQEIKQQLQEALIWPIKYSRLFGYADISTS